MRRFLAALAAVLSAVGAFLYILLLKKDAKLTSAIERVNRAEAQAELAERTATVINQYQEEVERIHDERTATVQAVKEAQSEEDLLRIAGDLVRRNNDRVRR